MDNKNLFLAIALSLAILLGWQMLIEGPRREAQLAEQQRQELLAQQHGAQTGGGEQGMAPSGGPAVPSAVGAAGVAKPRADIIAEGQRITLRNGRVDGSINLNGGRIDDITLHNYSQTTDPDSPPITLLSPTGAPNPYFAEFGWLDGSGVVLGGRGSQWQTQGTTLEDNQPLVLTWDNGAGLRITRTYALDDAFMFTVTDQVENTGNAPLALSPFGRIVRINTPQTSGFFILHEGPVGILDGTLREIDYDDLEDEPAQIFDTTGGWLGITDKYWLTALIPDQNDPVRTRFSYARTAAGADLYQTDFQGAELVLEPGESAEVSNRLFAGAKVYERLIGYRDDLDIPRFEMAIDFGWFFFLTKPLLQVIIVFAETMGNFGLAILLVTVIIKIFFFPLANKSYKAMSAMKALQPKMTEIREKYGDDKQRMQQELMAMYKREKVNPVSGCLPIALQIPVFFALYKVLFVSIEMRHAPFFGWVEDLSAPDPLNLFTLFGAIPWDPPSFLALGLWPLLMGITMFLQQKLNPAPADPIQARMFMLMPVIFTIFLASFPVGLVIYWTWNNTLSILQQYVIMRRMGVAIGGGKATT